MEDRLGSTSVFYHFRGSFSNLQGQESWLVAATLRRSPSHQLPASHPGLGPSSNPHDQVISTTYLRGNRPGNVNSTTCEVMRGNRPGNTNHDVPHGQVIPTTDWWDDHGRYPDGIQLLIAPSYSYRSPPSTLLLNPAAKSVAITACWKSATTTAGRRGGSVNVTPRHKARLQVTECICFCALVHRTGGVDAASRRGEELARDITSTPQDCLLGTSSSTVY
jgi:hypothetical protein